MGCCVSTDQEKRKTSAFQTSEPWKPKSLNESRAPPPSLEEETVKEVLSETPKPKPPPPTPPLLLQRQKSVKNPHQEQHQHQETNLQSSNKVHVEPPFLDDVKVKDSNFSEEKVFHEEVISEQEVSALSDVYSLSLSETVSTTTLNDGRRDQEYNNYYYEEEEAKPQRLMSRRSPSAPRSMPPRNRVVGRSPTRRSDQSPVKRNNAASGGGGGFVGGGSVRLVQSREQGQLGRRVMRSDPNKRNLGDGSGRRSRSPATNRSAIGRGPSIRRANRSPGRVREEPPESGIKVENGMESKWPSSTAATATAACASASAADNDTSANESIENPLVSLECFIFL